MTALFAVLSLFLTISADSSLLRLFRPAASLIPSLSSSPPGRLKHVVGLWRHAFGATSSRLQCSQCQSRYWSKGYRRVDLVTPGLAVLVLTVCLASLPLFELGVDLASLPLLTSLVLPFAFSRRSLSRCTLSSDAFCFCGSQSSSWCFRFMPKSQHF